MVPFRKMGEDFLDNRFRHIRDMIEKIILDRDLPEIICADMNYNEDIEMLIPAVFENSFISILNDEPTTPKGRSYDKIIISKEWKIKSTNILKGKADHFLCYADIGLNQMKK